MIFPIKEEVPVCSMWKPEKDKCEFDGAMKTIYTKENTLNLYPDFGYEINGLKYQITYGDEFSPSKKEKIITSKDGVVVDNIAKYKEVNVYIKPNINSLNNFKEHTLKILYKKDSPSAVSVLTKYDADKIDRLKHKSIYDAPGFEENIYRNFTELKFNRIDENLLNKLKGKIMLQVESHGEAWYVNPTDYKRYYMASGDEAFKIMRNFGIGIKNSDLNKIKTDKNYAKKFSGKIMLQVESHGEAYYIDFNGGVHYLKDGAAAYDAMRNLGLGINNSDLNKIPVGNLW